MNLEFNNLSRNERIRLGRHFGVAKIPPDDEIALMAVAPDKKRLQYDRTYKMIVHFITCLYGKQRKDFDPTVIEGQFASMEEYLAERYKEGSDSERARIEKLLGENVLTAIKSMTKMLYSTKISGKVYCINESRLYEDLLHWKSDNNNVQMKWASVISKGDNYGKEDSLN